MSRWILAGVGMAALIGAAQLDLRAEPRSAAQHESERAAESGAAEARALLNRYCVACHNRRTQTAGLALDTLDVAQIETNAATWEHVIRRLRADAMPPAGRPRPAAAATHEFIEWLESGLDRAGLENPDPGRPAVHRLNRAEYANAIRDIFGLEIDVNALLPADDEQEGFDNIADVLSVSPTLIERYLAAARRISQLVVGDTNVRAVAEVYPVHGAMDQDGAVSDDLPFGSRGGVAIDHHFPVDGEYIIRLSLRKQEYGYVRGLGRSHELDVRVDGERVGGFTVGRDWEQGQRPPMGYAGKFEDIYDSRSFPDWELYSLHADEGLEVRTPVTAGRHKVGLSFHRRPALPEGILPLPLDRSTYSFGQNEFQEGNPGVSEVQIIGPYNPSGAAELPSRDRLFVCEPTGGEAGEERCARTIFSRLARQAYRRPATAADVDTLLPFYRDGRTEGGFDAGLQAAVERLLVDPEFLFRIETDPPDILAGTPYRLGDLELASRLSFFLWSSIPDDELLDVAAEGRLSEPAVLDEQIERMLADPRSKALVENFAGQWLQLRKLRNATPDTATYTAFDENLREAMWQETELFMENELREDRPVVNALRANYTFVNERLARHYGIPDVHGVHFRRVEYPDDTRGGILGHASLLTITSYANRTSPVVRGVWLLENVLGTPPSPAPPDVPSLPSAADEGGTPRSVRERLEQHRTNAICASCHNSIDPLGFALEEFDAIGRWRATNGGGTPFDTGIPINASGTLIDGTELHGLAGLRSVILEREDQFVETVTEKLLTYALGRTLEHNDMPVVRRISRQVAPGELTWSTLVSSVVKSTPFLMRRSES